jgi:hypothetical protein
MLALERQVNLFTSKRWTNDPPRELFSVVCERV